MSWTAPDGSMQPGDPPAGHGDEIPRLPPPGQGPNPAPPSAPSWEEQQKIRQQQEEAARQAAAKAAYDAHFQYGGTPNGANDAANRYRTIGEVAQGRPGEQIDYTRSEAYSGQAQRNGASQQNVADLMFRRANGQTPSIAQMQADRQMRQASAEQSSAAAGARGPAALALAQQGAAANTAGMQSNISNQAQINAANERLQAENAAMAGFTGMRGQDLQGMGLEQDAAQKQAQINAAQRSENDRMQLGMTGAETDVNKAQLGAQGNQVGIETGVQTANANRDAAKDMHSEDRTDKYIGYTAGALGGAAAIAASAFLGGGNGGMQPGQGGVAGTPAGTPSGGGPAGGDGINHNPGTSPGDPGGGGGGASDQSDPNSDPWRAKGGPVDAGSPYIVGERGPELVVPRNDGTVIPAEQTRALMDPVDMHAMLAHRALDAQDAGSVVPLRQETDGLEQHYDRDVRAAKTAPDAMTGASLSGPTPKYSMAKTLERLQTAPAKQAKRKPTVDELQRQANAMLGSQSAQHEAQLGQGPAVGAEGADKAPARPAARRSHGGTHKRFDDGYSSDFGEESDAESLGPSGRGNAERPDYNFVKSQSPLDVAAAIETHPDAITPKTEDYMRREGMWGAKTDALLQERGLRSNVELQRQNDEQQQQIVSMARLLRERGLR